jgi:DNA-binding CsgD family transcriptional regulator
MAAPFVGRQRELDSIAALVAASSRASSPGAVLILGDPGSGKSRLLEEARDRTGLDHRFEIVGFEPERPVPLAAARDLLAALASAGHEGRRLAPLVYDTHPGSLEPLRIFEGAHRAMTDHGHALLTIDDLQWIDDLTIALCHYLVRAAYSLGHPLTLLVASRSDQPAQSFGESVRGVIGESLFLALEMEPLDRRDGVRLAMQLDKSLDERSAAAIWEKSGGLPYWLESLARSRDEASGVDALISTRIAGMSGDAASLLALISVAGRPLPLAAVVDLLDWTTARAEGAAEELVARGTGLRAGPGIRAAHDLVREATLREMPTTLIKRNHESVGEWLEAEAGDDDLHLLREAFEHRRAAGLQCSDLALKLLRSKRRRLLTGEDLRELVDVARDEESSGADPTAVLWEIAGTASEIGDPKLALDKWLDVGTRTLEPNLRARALLNASRSAMKAEDYKQARVLLSQCRSIALDNPLLAIEIDAHESELAGSSREEALVPMQRAIRASRKVVEESGALLSEDARRAYRAALQANLYFALRTEQPVEMLTIAEEMAAAGGSAEARLTSTLDAALALRILGRYGEAETRCRGVWLEARQNVYPAIALQAAYMLAGTLHHLGRLEEAKAAATEVVDMIDRSHAVIPTWLSSAWIKSLPHEIDVSMGDWKEAIAAIEHLAEEEQEPHFRLNIRIILGHWLARMAGRSAAGDVVRVLEDGAADADRAGCTRCWAEFTVRAAQAYARVGRTETARRQLSEWDRSHPRPVGLLSVWRRHAEALAIVTEDPLHGGRLMRDMIDVFGALGDRLEEAWTWLDLGAALGEARRDDAVDALRRAQEIARSVGAASEAQKAAQGLRKFGVRTWRRAAATEGPEHLTPREREIARLVTQGASNPEIAEAVFLSRKTIERHVSNIMAKLGVRNRTELASKFLELAG